jgi:hypothetical protein
MRATVIASAIAVPAAAAALALPALAAKPVGGAHYVGRTSIDTRVSLRVSDDGRSIPKNGFAVTKRATCSNGERVRGSIVSFRMKVKADGSFVQRRSGGLRSDRDGPEDAGGYRFRITGKFGPRRVVTGTVKSVTKQNNGIVCRTGVFTYTARVVED